VTLLQFLSLPQKPLLLEVFLLLDSSLFSKLPLALFLDLVSKHLCLQTFPITVALSSLPVHGE